MSLTQFSEPASRPLAEQHVLVIRLSAMGDVAIMAPVLNALLKQHPQLSVTLLTPSQMGTHICRHSSIKNGPSRDQRHSQRDNRPLAPQPIFKKRRFYSHCRFARRIAFPSFVFFLVFKRTQICQNR